MCASSFFFAAMPSFEQAVLTATANEKTRPNGCASASARCITGSKQLIKYILAFFGFSSNYPLKYYQVPFPPLSLSFLSLVTAAYRRRHVPPPSVDTAPPPCSRPFLPCSRLTTMSRMQAQLEEALTNADRDASAKSDRISGLEAELRRRQVVVPLYTPSSCTSTHPHCNRLSCSARVHSSLLSQS